MVTMGQGGVPGELHFDVTEDALVLESLLRVFRTALSYRAREGMAGQTEDGLRWRVNGAGQPIRVAFLGEEGNEDWVARRWEGYALEVPWATAQRALRSPQSLEMLANTLYVKKSRRAF